MNKWILVALIGLTPTVALADDSDYRYCPVVGYFFGKGDDFMGDLMARQLMNRKVFGDTVCTAAWRDGYAAGQFYLKNNRHRNEGDRRISDMALSAKAKAQDFILRGAGLD